MLREFNELQHQLSGRVELARARPGARQRMPSAARLRHAQPLNASVMQQMIPRGTGEASKAECRLSWEIL
jgi:hypothetical protein